MTPKALSMIEQVELQKENAELNTALQEREQQLADLKAMVNELLDIVQPMDGDSDEAKRWNWILNRIRDIKHVTESREPGLTIHVDHNKAIAEKVRERCADACFGIEDEEKIRNLSIDALLEE